MAIHKEVCGQGSFSAGTLITYCNSVLVPSYFSNVATGGFYNSPCFYTGSNGNPTLIIGQDASAGGRAMAGFRTADGGMDTIVGLTPASDDQYHDPAIVYTCRNGAVIVIKTKDDYATEDSNNDVLAILITKDNRNVTTVVASGRSWAQQGDGAGSVFTAIHDTDFRSNLLCYAEDNTAPLERFSFIADMTTQSQLVPFTTCPEYGVLSYTPNAFYIPRLVGSPSSRYDTWFEANVNGYRYLTNGYWAIRDDAAVG